MSASDAINSHLQLDGKEVIVVIVFVCNNVSRVIVNSPLFAIFVVAFAFKKMHKRKAEDVRQCC